MRPFKIRRIFVETLVNLFAALKTARLEGVCGQDVEPLDDIGLGEQAAQVLSLGTKTSQ